VVPGTQELEKKRSPVPNDPELISRKDTASSGRGQSRGEKSQGGFLGGTSLEERKLVVSERGTMTGEAVVKVGQATRKSEKRADGKTRYEKTRLARKIERQRTRRIVKKPHRGRGLKRWGRSPVCSVLGVNPVIRIPPSEDPVCVGQGTNGKKGLAISQKNNQRKGKERITNGWTEQR